MTTIVADKRIHSISHSNEVKRFIQIQWKRRRFIKTQAVINANIKHANKNHL